MVTNNTDLAILTRFIVKAKLSTFATDGGSVPSSQLASQDMEFTQGDWAYRDSFFGTQDFIGHETVYHKNIPVWGMVYLGRVLQPGVSKSKLWTFLKTSLVTTYAEDRFLGPSTYKDGEWRYEDTNQGDTGYFSGEERIYLKDLQVYRLHYFGGLIK